MLILIAILVFVVVALAAFVVFSLLDERKARARSGGCIPALIV